MVMLHTELKEMTHAATWQQLYQNIVLLYIKLKGMTHAASWQQIFYPHTLSTWGVESNGKSLLIHNMVMLHIKLNGITNCSNMVANILRADPNLGGGVKRTFFRIW